MKTGARPVLVKEACAIENNLSLPQERDWLLSLIARADQIISSSDSEAMILSMLDLMMEITQADSANLFQLDQETDELILTHMRADSNSQYLIGLRLNRHQGLPGISLCDSRYKVIGDLPGDPDLLRPFGPDVAASKKNVINLPVTHQDQTLGVIQIFNYQQAEIDLLTVFCNRLAGELNRRREMEGIQQSNQRLLNLVSILGDVAGTLDRDQLLHLVTESAAHLVDAERSSLFLQDPFSNQTIFQLSYHHQDEKTAPSMAHLRSTRQLRKYPSAQVAHPTSLRKNEFTHYNRSAITVPLGSHGDERDFPEDQQPGLGGLMVQKRPGAAFKEEDLQLLKILANQASTFLQVAEMYEATEELFLGVIRSLITAIEAKDPYTQGHSQRVSDYSVLIARGLNFNEQMVNDIRIGSLLHDIGKIGMPDSILLKKGSLTTEEYEYMKKHPSMGINILSQVKLLQPMQPAILEHHERLNGSGYPSKLKESQISWMGRIVAVADVFDAMTSDRPYRKALSFDEILLHLQENAGTLFDPQCVQALESILPQMFEA